MKPLSLLDQLGLPVGEIMPVDAFEMPVVISCQLRVASCQLPVDEIKMPVASCELRVASCQLPVDEIKMRVASCELPVASCQTQMSLICYHLLHHTSYTSILALTSDSVCRVQLVITGNQRAFFRIIFYNFQLTTGKIMCNWRVTGRIMCNW